MGQRQRLPVQIARRYCCRENESCTSAGDAQRPYDWAQVVRARCSLLRPAFQKGSNRVAHCYGSGKLFISSGCIVLTIIIAHSGSRTPEIQRDGRRCLTCHTGRQNSRPQSNPRWNYAYVQEPSHQTQKEVKCTLSSPALLSVMI